MILLLAVYYLFQQIQSLKEDNTKELTELFETYLKEIRNENRRLESEMKTNVPEINPVRAPRELDLDVDKSDITAVVETDETILETDTVHDQFETSLEARILQLYHQGVEVTEIAQMLNCGKTEASLIINLYKRKNQKS